MDEQLLNVAYTAEYMDYLTEIDKALFCSEYFVKENQETLENLTIKTRRFVCDSHPNYPYGLEGSETDILIDDNTIYSFRTHDDHYVFDPFIHQNGNQYLVFRQDLYGYSVLNITSRQDYRYYPKGSFPEGETFIWCRLHYNPHNNIAAVDGCFWACSSGIVLADFTDPMQDTTYIDINEHVNFKYNGIEFMRWEGTDLVGKRRIEKEMVEIIIKEEEYLSWLEADRQA